MRVKDHYDSFLGSVYSWILGDFDAAYRKYVDLFATLELVPCGDRTAIDLGCGPGCQSVPLDELGYDVLAIDFCQALLDELADRSGTLPIKPICDDIGNFQDHIENPVDLIVCMGDTLVHLPDRESVHSVIAAVCKSLKPGGVFIYAIRDYVQDVPTGAARFIPVRASDEQIFTCFLDYRDDVVHVHDILYQKQDDEWKMSVSDYLKLRLDSAVIDRQLITQGLDISRKTETDGMITVMATKTL